jgi:ATP-binding cassette subfamily B protein
VVLENVSLLYEGAKEPALRDVSLDVAAGTTVALVGATGSGKSTLAQLLPRLYDPTEGEVLVDGVDVRTVDLPSLRGAIAVVNDDPFLFSASVHENIAYAREDAAARRSSRPRAARRPTSSSSGCPTATTPRSASAA